MEAERIKEIQKETAYPDSVSVQQALFKVWNECEQDHASQMPSEEVLVKFAMGLSFKGQRIFDEKGVAKIVRQFIEDESLTKD